MLVSGRVFHLARYDTIISPSLTHIQGRTVIDAGAEVEVDPGGKKCGPKKSESDPTTRNSWIG